MLTVMPDSIAPLPVHTVMSQNGIPLFVYAVTDAAIVTDPEHSFQLADTGAVLTKLPIDVAAQNEIDKVTVVGFDIPAVSGFYEAVGAADFEDAGLEFEYVPVPPGQADITGPMIEIANGDPTVVRIVGDASLCIATLGGLQSAGFEGPITVLNECVKDPVTEAVGSYMDRKR